ncbi:hypothetical protein ACO0LB_04960 [Undibacterium sp. SXout7W]|uniref:hypothetical protein n=1 Tax=Undibacterium sp. SXout7W TaxID=3413049 RepID=UPI003BF11CF4
MRDKQRMHHQLHKLGPERMHDVDDHLMTTFTLPDTASLLIAGGDSRIIPDPVTGKSKYGCRNIPEPQVLAFGSSTASTISERGMVAATALQQRLTSELQATPSSDAEAVYRQHASRLRSEIAASCGLSASDEAEVLIAASGTDIHLILAQWLQVQRTIMIDSCETGSGLAAALQGRHFNQESTCNGQAPAHDLVSTWQAELCLLPARQLNGDLADAAQTSARLRQLTDDAANAGKNVLLILTDVSKTGLIFPDISTVLALQQRWPGQVHVLVDACQFRIAPYTIRAYLAQGFMLALTGSKFMTGPTFSGALLLPQALVRRYQLQGLPEGVRAYSNAADWPESLPAAQSLMSGHNFGLLLRWEAALAELRAFQQIDEPAAIRFIRQFGDTIRRRLAEDAHFSLLPTTSLRRSALHTHTGWDEEQTIFSFVLYQPDRPGVASTTGTLDAPSTPDCMYQQKLRKPLSRQDTQRIYLQLQQPSSEPARPGIALGQPVLCGERDGVPVSALRLCLSAPLLVAAQQPEQASMILKNVIVAIDRMVELIEALAYKN